EDLATDREYQGPTYARDLSRSADASTGTSITQRSTSAPTVFHSAHMIGCQARYARERDVDRHRSWNRRRNRHGHWMVAGTRTASRRRLREQSLALGASAFADAGSAALNETTFKLISTMRAAHRPTSP